ncbi:leucyl/phenylalanyl-tRNA--protein transferase [Aquimarina brevivitae]|uniref:Leucyl/phenylalanyl-tRNA--protein transferase n=1 Tax=Aquimarina brevivitae TaxID=323412 RepID=A0A4Q7PI27_9FLAO|nr:leucyl/phenylalanyl-tRNA--protein transferase [Aquimarina brevivitae]RZS99618.1 leucyl/phenylalanyl-tRNA--protein transferase [Aquimarina brevivitae]
MFFLGTHIDFPPVTYADQDGLLAIGGDLSTERLLYAYNHGIFPWYNEGQPILWFSPDPRMVLFPDELKVSKSMKQVLRKNLFQVTFNTQFTSVIQNCSSIMRPGQQGTWITDEMKEAYTALHEKGIAMSTEVWQDEMLVGGLYGVWLKEKGVFCGESMFAKVSNASKVGFISLIRHLKSQGLKLVDCQVYTDHLASLGAKEISRNQFLSFLK